jgi:aminoglycoside phosphotransferase (APT) family kinase protein
MTQPWSAECVVSDSLARSLIEGQFPELAPAHVELLGAGWDNTAFRVNGTCVFRFPRRQFAVPFLVNETRLLPAIAPLLPLAVPRPVYVGRPRDDYPWPFAGYPLLPGRTACAAALDEAQRTAAAEPLAHFLRSLHGVPTAEATRMGVGPDTLGRLNVARNVPRARELLDRLAQERLLEDGRPFMALLEAAPADYSARSDTLLHGDLYVRHLLVDAERRLRGVIDWGDVHLGDPAVDLAVVHSFLPPSARPAFRRAYGPIEDCTWQQARRRAVWHTLNVLAYAHDSGDTDLVREGQQSLNYIARG